MNKQLTWKTLTVLGVLAVAVYGYLHYGINLGIDLKGGTSFLLKVDLSEIEAGGRHQAMQQSLAIIRKRVDKYGVGEPIIQQVGDERIQVQIPMLKQADVEDARATLKRTAFLEFRLVHKDNDDLVREADSDPTFEPPLGYVRLEHEGKLPNGQVFKRSYFVRKKYEMTGVHVKRAFPSMEPSTGEPYVAMEFDSEGAKEFGRITSANVNRLLAIVLDGELYSAPEIRGPITGGQAQISGGNMTLADAQQLANVLENPLQSPIAIAEERGVDPSLGQDSIASGVKAALIGAAIVVIFMPLYYRFAGLVAVISLALNMVVLFGVLAMFGFTLTLPGIAGIVLTIGMSVDANVLIHERIREELAANKTLRGAIAAGYQRAFIVIFDSNLTTILTALILIWLGSGPVKGFGVTLTIGLLANLFTAVFATRVMFDWLVESGWMKSFNMLHLIRPTKFNFLGGRRWAFGVALALIVAGGIIFVQRGGVHLGKGSVYGVDFTGGDAVTLQFAQKIDSTRLRQSLDQAGLPDSFIQYQRDAAGAHEVLSLKLVEGASGKAVAALQAGFPEAQFTLLGTERVGATVGKELLTQALEATGLALLAIMIYVAFRFGEFAYGVGALVSLVTTVLMTVGLFCLVGRTFSLPVVAAVLTVIGYSINDTIVVFDRIREDKKLAGGRVNYFDLINRSINETLSRTVVTGGTTMLATLAILMFGGSVLNDFAFTFLVGMITGTFASIFIASPIVLWYHRNETGKAKADAARKPEPARA